MNGLAMLQAFLGCLIALGILGTMAKGVSMIDKHCDREDFIVLWAFLALATTAIVLEAGISS